MSVALPFFVCCGEAFVLIIYGDRRPIGTGGLGYRRPTGTGGRLVPPSKYANVYDYPPNFFVILEVNSKIYGFSTYKSESNMLHYSCLFKRNQSTYMFEGNVPNKQHTKNILQGNHARQ